MATVTETPAPRRIEMSLLVVEGFKDRGGVEYLPGDRVSLRSRNVRLAALERPELFVMEYETAPVDQDWLRQLDARYEAEYKQAKRGRDEQKAHREKALRDDLKEQERGQPELERRFAEQEKERAERQKRLREDLERKGIEHELEFEHGRIGFHN